MSAVTSTNALAKDSTLQDVADAIETMSATSVGNMAALQTTDKTSLVGAVNELKSGLINHAFTETAITSGNIETYLDEYRYAFMMVTVPSQDWSVLSNWVGNFDGFIIKIGDVALAFDAWSATEMPWFKYKWGSNWTGWIKIS